jgi:hypothetical protein
MFGTTKWKMTNRDLVADKRPNLMRNTTINLLGISLLSVLPMGHGIAATPAIHTNPVWTGYRNITIEELP